MAIEIDWARVKRRALWTYEDLIKRMLKVLTYGFVQERCNHTMQEAQGYAERIQQGYLQGRNGASPIEGIVASLRTLECLQIGTYLDLVRRVETRQQCSTFLTTTDLSFDQLIDTLNYLFRLVLPFEIPVRELIDADNDTHRAHLQVLRQHGLRSNLDILEHCRTRGGRAELSTAAGIPRSFVLALAHRADVSRLAYVRGKTVKHLAGAGYDNLDKIANADIERMEQDMDAYCRTIGKRFADLKSVIPLPWMIGGAGVLPRVIED